MLKNKLTNNIVWKLVSLVIAAIIWFAIMNIADPVTTETFTGIPVSIVNDDIIVRRGYKYTVESGEQVDITCKGRRSVILALTNNDFVATADFETLDSMYMANITAECTSPNASEIKMSLRTEKMAVKREDSVTEPYSVRVVLTGAVRDGYYCYGTSMTSSLIQITGAESQIRSVKDIIAYVNIEDRTETFTDEYKLVAYDENGMEIDSMKLNFSQDKVTVTVGIYRTKSVGIKIETAGTPVNGYYVEKVEYAPQTVLVAADRSVLDELDSITLSVDVSGASKPVESLIALNDYLISTYGNNVYAVDDSTYIGIVADVSPFEERILELRESDIEVRNVGEELEYTLESLSDHTIRIRGALDVISSITTADLKLFVDMENLSAGTHARQIRSDYGSQIMVDSVSASVRLSPIPKEDDGGGE
ncbi:MAG: hypothetical protein K6G81_06080 [Lachnospiraceae bacterium]|nr:hypothetical protein [Lachnospiraceae bacterium]